MEFFMPMIPPTATAQEHKITKRYGKTNVYDPPRLADARAKLTAHLARYRPAEPLGGAIELRTQWLFPRGHHKNGEYKITRPDTDNLQKMIKDCMTKLGYWNDDAQVCVEIVEKKWAETPGIYISVESLEKSECKGDNT